MTRNVRTYDHFCLVARTLEQVGERWSLLVIRDLVTGPKRFTDLMDRLGGITPKTLTQRLRDLADAGLVPADRQSGRREVWYQLTESGMELEPVVDALNAWGLAHAWRLPLPGERLHPEHLLRMIAQAATPPADDEASVLWHFRFPGGDYVVQTEGQAWSLSTEPPRRSPDATVSADVEAFTPLAIDPTRERALELGVRMVGDDAQIKRLLHWMAPFAEIAKRA